MPLAGERRQVGQVSEALRLVGGDLLLFSRGAGRLRKAANASLLGNPAGEPR
jgi:hypothetical protein